VAAAAAAAAAATTTAITAASGSNTTKLGFLPQGMYPWRRHCKERHVSGRETHRGRGRRVTNINKQVLPQAPSPTMTSFRRISAMVVDGLRVKVGVELGAIESWALLLAPDSVVRIKRNE
jgi:hypothetical protein